MRLPGLDGIRAVSIALVILFHVSTSNAGRTSMVFGAFGVDVFFVLSGFLITWLLCCEENEHSSISLQAFYARRALRILPPALTYLAVLCILTAYGLVSISSADIAGCLFFARNVVSGSAQTEHYWSLSLEEQFYLIWPLAMVLLRSNRARLKFSIAMLAVSPLWHFISYWLAGGAAFVNHQRFDQRYEPILVGGCLALMRNDAKLLAWLRSSWLQFRWFPLAAIGCLIPLVQIPQGTRLSYVIVVLFINYAIEHPGGPLNWGPLVWVGKLSYSLYIWQQLFCWQSTFAWVGRFPQNIIATVLAASLSYYFIEQPFARLRKRVRFIQSPAWLMRLQMVKKQPETSSSSVSV